MDDKCSLRDVVDSRVDFVAGCLFRVNPFYGTKLGSWVVEEGFECDIEPNKHVISHSTLLNEPFASKMCQSDEGYTLTLFGFDQFIFRSTKFLYYNDLKKLCSECEVSFIMTPITSDQPSIILNHLKQYNVYQAEKLIKMFIVSLKIDSRSTHFLNVPVDLEEEQRTFIDKVIDELPMYNDIGNYFINPKLLHLTITTFCLFNETDVNQFKETFNISCAKHAQACFKEGPLIVNIGNLATMQDDLSQAKVVYARVEEPGNSNRLQTLFNNIVADLRVFGYISKKVNEDVLIHMTVMKSLKARRNKPRPTFDARPLFSKFGNYRFGPTLLPSIHFSVLTEINKNTEYYECLQSTELN